MKNKQTKNSPAKIKANTKYNTKVYDHISIIVHKGDKDKIKQEAEKVNESMNQYINTAIQRRISSGK